MKKYDGEAWDVRLSHERTWKTQDGKEHTHRTNAHIIVLAATVARAAELAELSFDGLKPVVWQVNHRSSGNKIQIVIDDGE